MSTKYNGNSPEVAIPTPGSPATPAKFTGRSLVLDYQCVSDENRRIIPADAVAAVQVANMRAWLAGVALITIVAETAFGKKAASYCAPSPAVRIDYRTHTGKDCTHEMVYANWANRASDIGRSWWTLRQFVSWILRDKYGCARCGGSGTAKSAPKIGHTRLFLGGSFGTCFRCWGAMADPAVVDYIATGGNPVEAEIDRPALPFIIE